MSRRGVSLVLSAMVVTVVFLGLVSASLAALYLLQQSSNEVVRREAERAMEAFFTIYWVNSTHVALFNKHGSVGILLKYWVTSDTSINVFNLNPLDYSVRPGEMKIVKAADPPRSPNKHYRVVSERGTAFNVNPAPSEVFSTFALNTNDRLVRPGFSPVNGPLVELILGTGPEFGGGYVSISCVSVVPAPASCAAWDISFSPSSLVNVPSGSVVLVSVYSNIPLGTPTGTYFLRLKLETDGGLAKEYLVKVVVADFSFYFRPTDYYEISLGCAVMVDIVITVSGDYTGLITFDIKGSNLDPRVNWGISPNPVQIIPGISHTRLNIHVDYDWRGDWKGEIVLLARDNLGPELSGTITVLVADRLCFADRL